MRDRVELIVVRPLHFRGVALSVGATIDCTLLDAADLVASGRVRLARAGDADAVHEAATAERNRLLAALVRAPRWLQRVA